MSKILLGFAMITAGFLGSASSQTRNDCGRTAYENHNQVDYGPVAIREVAGMVVDPQGVPIPKVCLVVFTDKDKKVVASAESDSNGQFMFPHIPPGEYRLLAKYGSFCVANARLQVTQYGSKKRRLQVQMKPSGVDACSYVRLSQIE